jgi:hypothetical protein
VVLAALPLETNLHSPSWNFRGESMALFKVQDVALATSRYHPGVVMLDNRIACSSFWVTHKRLHPVDRKSQTHLNVSTDLGHSPQVNRRVIWPFLFSASFLSLS